MNWREKNDDGCDVDLGLSLSLQLKCPSKKSYMPSLKGIAFPSSSASRPKSVRGLDMNMLAAVTDTVPPPLSAVSSSPDSTITSANGKRSERDETLSERYSASSEGGGGDDASARKKLRLSKEQTAVLEERFGRQCTLNQNQKVALAKQLNLQTRQVEVWFQNRRARTKSKKTEVDCAYLKRHCEDLMDENRRLKKEVAELKALKHSPQMKPPTTLAKCPRCERVSNVPKLSPATSSTPSAATEMPTASNWLINRLQETRRPRP